jgi:CRISPR-associated protein Cas2
MFVVVSYDIPDDRRRTRLSDTLLDFGQRIQYSVFECILDDAKMQEMRDRIRKVVKADEDGVRVYRLCGQCRDNVEVIGNGELTQDPDVYIV